MPEYELRQYVASCLELRGRFSFTLIRDGGVNVVYRCMSEQGDWAVKRVGQRTFADIDYAAVAAVQQQVAQIGEAPEVTVYDPLVGVWIEPWITSPPITTSIVQRLAGALARVHRLKVEAPELNLVQSWRNYLPYTSCDQRELLALKTQQLEQRLTRFSQPTDKVFCHNDLSAGHLVGGDTHIIDWEYAAFGNRFFDVCTCILINKLNDDQSNALCQYYGEFIGCSALAVQQGVEQFMPIAQHTFTLWQCAFDQAEQK